MTEPSGKTCEKGVVLRGEEEEEVEEVGMVEPTTSSSTATWEKDTTEKGARESGDGEHSRSPGESKERGRREYSRARFEGEEERSRSSQRQSRPGDGYGTARITTG